MARNGSGTYNLPAGNPVTTGTTISSTWANGTLSDMATALTGSVASDGQTTPTANLPMGTFAHTNVGNATVRNMYPSAGQIQDGVITYLTSVAGTNVITAVGAVGMTAYATGQTFCFIAAGASTGAVTININSIGAKSLVKTDGSALVTGDIASGAAVQVMYDGTNFQLLSDANGSNETVGNLTVTGTTTATGLITANGGLAATTISASGVATFSAGSAAAPSITTTGDTDTGMFFGTANQVNFAANGTKVFTILPAGIIVGENIGALAAYLEIGDSRTADGISVIDFHSSVGVDYDLRIFRGSGVNGLAQIENLGAGGISFLSNGYSSIYLDAYGNVQAPNGAVMPYAPSPTSISSATTLTNANLQTQIINTTGTSYTVTLPTGSTLETLAGWYSANIGYDFWVINTASGTITIGANGNSTLGSLTVATGVSAQFRLRRTAANTFTLYRLG